MRTLRSISPPSVSSCSSASILAVTGDPVSRCSAMSDAILRGRTPISRPSSRNTPTASGLAGSSCKRVSRTTSPTLHCRIIFCRCSPHLPSKLIPATAVSLDSRRDFPPIHRGPGPRPPTASETKHINCDPGKQRQAEKAHDDDDDVHGLVFRSAAFVVGLEISAEAGINWFTDALASDRQKHVRPLY